MKTHCRNQNRIAAVSRVALAIFATIFVATASRADVITWTNSASGSFGNPANWSPNQVPGGDDTAVITTNGITVSLDTERAVGGIMLGDTLNCGSGGPVFSLNGQRLDLNGVFQINSCGQFTVASGEFFGNSTNAHVSGAFGWTAGTINGTLTLDVNTTLAIANPANNHDWPGCVITNYGTIIWTGGEIRGGSCNASQIFNYGTWDCQSDSGMDNAFSCANTIFNNLGTFRKSVGSTTNATTFFGGVLLNNAGVIDIRVGNLALQAGGTWSGGSVLNSGGNVLIQNGNFTIAGTVTATNVVQQSGSLVGLNFISGGYTWLNGGWNETSVTILTNTTVIIAGTPAKIVYDDHLTNYGTILWSGGPLQGGGCNGGSQIFNYGSWISQDDGVLNDAASCVGTTFNNLGIFQKIGGTNATQFQGGVVMVNSGTLDVETGSLSLQGGGNLIGGQITAVAGLLTLDSGNFTINGTVTTPNVILNGGNLAGANVITGGFEWVAGAMDNSTVVLSTNSVMTIAGGNGNNDLFNMTFTNFGTVDWVSGTLRGGGCSGGTSVYNYGVWDSQADLVFNNAAGCVGTVFNNLGTLRKSTGSATNSTQFQNGVTFNNTGVVDVRAGNLALSGNANLLGGTATNAAGNIVFTGAALNINGTLTSTNVQLDGANFTGNNIITGGFTWVAGTWDGVGITVASNGVLNIAGGAGDNDLFNSSLTNFGTIIWTSGTIRGGGCSGGTVINNYGVWDCQSDFILNDAAGCNGSVLNNFGTFRKSIGSPTNQTIITDGVAFNNAGTIDMRAGTLVMEGGGNWSGGTATNNAGILQLAGDNFTINGTVTSANVQENGANLIGNNVISGALSWISGVWNNAGVTIATNSRVNIMGGTGVNDFAQASVTNFGTIAWSSGTMRGGGCNGTVFNNYGVWDMQGDLILTDGGGCANTILNNFGTFRKSAGSLVSSGQILSSVVINNTGIFDVQAGNLSLQGGGTFSGGAATNSVGILRLDSGNYNINGTVTAATVELTGGNLTGNNVLSGGFTWISGNWNNANVTIATNSQVNVAGGSSVNDFSQGTIVNLGTVAWSSGTMRGGGCNGTTVSNFGLWDMQGDLTMNDGGGCANTIFNNLGTLRKSEGTGTGLLDSSVVFNNTGTLAALTGTLQFNSTPAFTSGDLEFGISGSTNFGVINAPGTVPLGGGISVVLLNGFTPSVGTPFTVLTYGNTNGAFTDFTGLNAGNGVAFTPTLGPTSLVLTTVATNFTAVGPTIVSQPAAQTTVNYGSTVTLQIGVAGTPPLSYQWTHNNMLVAGATNASLILTNVDFTTAGLYIVSVSNSVSGLVSSPAQVTVNPVLPSITSQPANVQIPQGSNAVFTAGVAGEPPPSLQWSYNGVNLSDGGRISGSHTTTLTISNVQPFDAGNYVLTATNGFGAAVSSPGMLQVNFPDLIVWNISTPTNAVIGQSATVTFTITNIANGIAIGPWQDEILLSTNSSGSNAVVLSAANFNGTLGVNGSAVVMQSATIPGNVVGPVYLGVKVNSASSIAEANILNNTSFSTNATLVQAADLSLTQFTAPPSAQFGQTINVNFSVTNGGSAATTAAWNDKIYLSSSSNLLNGATLLATIPGPSSLAAGATYSRTQSVSLPLTTQSAAGAFYLIAIVDADNSQIESNESNNQQSAALNLTLPALPDLVVGSIGTPSTGVGGQSITVTWAVTNIGSVAATNSWSESVYIVPANLSLAAFNSSPSSYPRIGVFTYTNILAPGTNIARSQQVTLPSTGIAGDLRAAVLVDINDNVIEQNETNNSGLATNDIEVPLLLSLSIPQSSVAENNPNPISAMITRNGDTIAPLIITLSNSAPANISVPFTVTIPAGTASALFTAQAIDDGVPDADTLVTISAMATNYQSASAQVTVQNADFPALAVSVASSPITQGQSIAVTVSRTKSDNSQPATVTMSATSTTSLAFPATVTIPAGSNSVTFLLSAVQNTFIAPAQIYTINASSPGYTGGSSGLTVLNDNAPLLTIALDRTNFNETDGAIAATATLTRAPATDQQVTIALANSNPGAIKIPTQIIVPSFQPGVTFPIAAVYDPAITGPKTAVITAQVLDTGNNPVGMPVQQTVTVQDANGPTLTVNIATKVVSKGLIPASAATVSANPAPTNNLVVTLSSSAVNEATVPASVTILAGQSNVTFNINSVDDGISDTNVTASITASAANYASGTAVISVTDLSTPDLVISSITASNVAYTDQPFTVGFRLSNQGLGALVASSSQSVFLTTDPTSSTGQVLLGTVAFPGPLLAGQFVDESLFVPASSLPPAGTYYLEVVADINQTIAELNEANNTLISSTPVVVQPEYSATVMAGATNGLAGNPVPLTGSATLTAGGPAPNRPVNIIITVRGLQRVISTTTDANGNFSTTFTPLPGEAGAYTAAAVAPGINSAPAQTQFNILGFSVNPSSLVLNVIQGTNATATLTLQNLGDVPLTGLSAIGNGLAANLSFSNNFSASTLSGMGTTTLSVAVTANDATIPESSFALHITSAEGAVMDIPVAVRVIALIPRLTVVPNSLSATMVRGSQNVVTLNVINGGGAPTGPVSVILPNAPWLGLGSINPLPSIAPGATNTVNFVLTPDANMALGPYTGTLLLNCANSAVQVPFTFTAVSDAHGAIQIQTEDEFTFFATNSPPLTNATVSVLDPFTSAVVAQGVTDATGNLLVTNLMQGVYELDVSAPQHTPFRGEATVSPGVTNNIAAFLSVETVTYVWTVVPTTVQDSNDIVITTTFEANVPAPVVVPTPASIDLAPLQQPGQVLDIPLTLVNQGLIAVSNLVLNLPTHPLYRFDIATLNVGTLAAHGTITIPIRITRLAAPGTSGLKPLDGAGPCNIQFGFTDSYPCGPFGIYQSVNITVQHVSGNCTPIPVSYSVGVSCNICGVQDGGGGYSSIPSNPGYNAVGVSVPPSISLPPQCNPCYEAALDCLIGFTPIGCIYSIVKVCAPDIIKTSANPGGGGVGVTKTVEDCAFTLIGCVGGPLGNVAGCIQGAITCTCNSGSISQCVSNYIAGGGGSIKALRPTDVGSGLNAGDLRDFYAARSYIGVEFLALVVGDTDGRWFTPGSGAAFSTFFNAFTDAAQPTSPGGSFISPDEATNLLSLPVPSMITSTDVVASISRWNLTVSNWQAGILTASDAPPGANTNFIDAYVYTNLLSQWGDELQESQAAGFNSPVDGLISALQASGKQAGATCAQVKIEIDQSAVLTRDAFHATLVLNNGATVPLSNVSVTLKFQNAAGEDVTSLFGIEAPTVAGDLTGVDGHGTLPAGGTGNAQWTLLPSIDAAPQAPTNYLVSGTFSYVENGATISIALAPAPIAVQPSPQLYLNYFLQRDVFADDPFTPEIEPSIPFPLAVMVQNKGYGVAQNFQITSAQPKIIDNEKGLLINFQIIGTQVAGQTETPSLTANFGNINANSVKVADFLFTSSLQGLFVDYQATFTHVDPLGNPRLSLIQGVTIHEMTHMVQADGAFDDGLPDFLTTENPNFGELPDTLFLSDGSMQPVSVVQADSLDAPADTNHLTVQLTAQFPAGFAYLLVDDPANGKLSLTNIQRMGGTNLLAPNYYLTDRTFTGQGQTPIRENKLHLFDYHTNAGTYTYVVTYLAPSLTPDTNPPISAVYALQPMSPAMFGVAWNGADFVGESGLAYYDIYSSDNGGAFTNWQSQTTNTGAVFNGLPGHTYAFYSLATDHAGNRETVPALPQAQTTVLLSNYPPSISITPLVNLAAGQTLSLPVTVSDSNVFANLTFSLAPGAPTGVRVDPNTGQILWATSLAQGGTTNFIRVIVTDDSQPPLTASATVQVNLTTIVDPPVLAAIPNYTIADGTLLTFTNSATDDTLPARVLAYSLKAGAPTGATVSATTGVFQWRPTANQAPSTNQISVIVSDNGTPTLSATQTFQVIVRSTSSEFLLSVGTTNVLAGNAAFVPLNLVGSLPLTNLTVNLLSTNGSLTNFTLSAVSPEVTSALVQFTGSNEFALTLSLDPSQISSNSRTLAQLNFAAAPQAHSAIVPLNLSELAGAELDGSSAPKPGTANGLVYLIAREPLLNATTAGGARLLTIFGKPWASYEVDYTTNYGTSWTEMTRIPLTNSYITMNVGGSLPQVFYRALEFSADPPLVELHTATPGNLSLLVYGQSGSLYTLLSSTNLPGSNWTSVAGFTFTNSFHYLNTGGTTNPAEFFRIKKQ